MTELSPSEGRPTNGERRAQAREKARRLRFHQQKRDRRRSVLFRGGLGLAIVVVLAVIAVVIVTSIRPPHSGPANMASDGILIGKGLKAVRTDALRPDQKPTPHRLDTTGSTVSIVAYVDYLSPQSGQFARANDGQIGKLVKSGAATVEVHPVAMLANQSAGTKYSLRAVNAAGCVANYAPDEFWNFNTALFANQPKEGTGGLSDGQLEDYAGLAGALHLHRIDRCIEDMRYSGWAQSALTRVLKGPIPNSPMKTLKQGTPLVLVNGQRYRGALTSADDFRSFLVQAQGVTAGTAAPTTPTPAPTATTTISSSSVRSGTG